MIPKKKASRFFNPFYSEFIMLNLYCSLLEFADLVDVFEIFLPQVLLYPNTEEPLNFGAGALMESDKNAYEEKVKGKFIDTCLSLHWKYISRCLLIHFTYLYSLSELLLPSI